LTEETTAEVPLALIGRDDVIHKGYELFQQLETLLLKGLPGQFPASIDINVSELSPGDQITVADLTLPEGVVSETEEDRLILSVSYPKVKEERDEDTDGAAVDAVEQPADEESKA
jgi:large subunit ribosomal protein L25